MVSGKISILCAKIQLCFWQVFHQNSDFYPIVHCTIVHICKGKAIVIKENGYTVEVSESPKKRQLFACQLYFGVCTVDVMKFDHQKRHHLSTIIYVGQGQLRNPFFLLLDQPLLFTTAHNKLVGRNKKKDLILPQRVV